MTSTATDVRAAHGAVQATMAAVTERLNAIKCELRRARDEAVQVMSKTGSADDLLQQLKRLETDHERLLREQAIVSSALVLSTSRVADVERGERELRDRHRAISGML